MPDGTAPLPAPFIVGVGRSGTTLLRLMLASHPELAIPAETHFLSEVLAAGPARLTPEAFLRLVTGAPTWPNLAVDQAAFGHALAAVEPFSAAVGLRTFYRLYAERHDKARWGDKTPTYRNHLVGIGRLLPEAHFIHLIRDGRDVALSHRGLWFGPGDDIERQALFWVDSILSVRAQSERVGHVLEIKYETLVTEPQSTLTAISRFLELPYSNDMLEYHRFAPALLAEIKAPFGPPETAPAELPAFMAIFERTKQPLDAGRIGRWRNAMSGEERRRYEAIAGPLLRDLGYETV